MKFKIDENLPIEFTEVLQAARHDAVTVSEQGLKGKDDAALADVCRAEKRVLVTLDLDFADINAYPPNQYSGIIVVRSDRQDKLSLLRTLQSILRFVEKEPLEHRLWIVEETRVRIRGD